MLYCLNFTAFSINSTGVSHLLDLVEEIDNTHYVSDGARWSSIDRLCQQKDDWEAKHNCMYNELDGDWVHGAAGRMPGLEFIEIIEILTQKWTFLGYFGAFLCKNVSSRDYEIKNTLLR